MDNKETKCYMNRIIKEYGATRTDIANVINSSRQYVGMLVAGTRCITPKMQLRLDKAFPPKSAVNTENIIQIPTSKGGKEYVYLDKSFFNDVINYIDFKSLFLHTITDYSMSPIYNINDKAVVCHSVKSFIDGHIFLFKYDETFFIRLINLLPDKIKCISLNKEFNTFYLNPQKDKIEIKGLIIPRIRL